MKGTEGDTGDHAPFLLNHALYAQRMAFTYMQVVHMYTPLVSHRHENATAVWGPSYPSHRAAEVQLDEGGAVGVGEGVRGAGCREGWYNGSCYNLWR